MLDGIDHGADATHRRRCQGNGPQAGGGPGRHRVRGCDERLPAGSPVASDAGGDHAPLPERHRRRAQHSRRRPAHQALHRCAGDGPARAAPARPGFPRAGAAAGKAWLAELHHHGPGDRPQAQERQLRPHLDPACRNRGRARHPRARRQYPDTGIRAPGLPHLHPDRTGAGARPPDDRAGLHRRVLFPVPALLPDRRRAALWPGQARLRAGGTGVRLFGIDQLPRRLFPGRQGRQEGAAARPQHLRPVAGTPAGGGFVRRLSALHGGLPGRQ